MCFNSLLLKKQLHRDACPTQHYSIQLHSTVLHCWISAALKILSVCLLRILKYRARTHIQTLLMVINIQVTGLTGSGGTVFPHFHDCYSSSLHNSVTHIPTYRRFPTYWKIGCSSCQATLSRLTFFVGISIPFTYVMRILRVLTWWLPNISLHFLKHSDHLMKCGQFE